MPSHNLNQWWNIVNWTFENKIQCNLYRNLYIFIHENSSENVVRKLATILASIVPRKSKWSEIHFIVVFSWCPPPENQLQSHAIVRCVPDVSIWMFGGVELPFNEPISFNGRNVSYWQGWGLTRMGLNVFLVNVKSSHSIRDAWHTGFVYISFWPYIFFGYFFLDIIWNPHNIKHSTQWQVSSLRNPLLTRVQSISSMDKSSHTQWSLGWNYLVKLQGMCIWSLGTNKGAEVWECIRNFISHFMVDVVAYRCWDQS